MSEAREKAGEQWESSYEGGKTPFSEEPFPCVVDTLREHCKPGGRALDMGAGYGRDSVWLAKELQCTVVAVEPSKNGFESLKSNIKKKGLESKVMAVHGTALDFDWSNQGPFDVVVMDSVLAFVPEDERQETVDRCCGGLAAGGKLVIVGFPNEENPNHVSTLVAASSCKGMEVLDDDCRADFEMEYEEGGVKKMHSAQWSFTTAVRRA